MTNVKKSKKLNEHTDTQLMEAGPTLNLRRHGWVKAPELNFSDDGNRFQGYYYDPKKVGDKRFPTSKLISDGYAYVSVHYVNSQTGNATYFDDLIGVGYEYAIEHLPELAKKLDDFIAKLDSEGEYVITLSQEQYDEIIAKCIQVHDLTGADHYHALGSVLKRLNIDSRDIERSQINKLRKEVESEIRNNKKEDPKLVKEMAVAYLKEVMKEMTDRSGYGYNRKWNSRPAKSLDDALKCCDPYVKLSDGEYHHLTNFSDATQNRIKAWARKKIETLYDFDDVE